MPVPTLPVMEFWLPKLSHFPVRHPLHRTLLCAENLAPSLPGSLPQLAECFDVAMPNMPVAALTREYLVNDAGTANWLCADPAWLQADMTGVRLMACGQMQLSREEASDFVDVLRPAFADMGCRLELSTPDRWHLKLPDDVPLPHFSTPDQALGEDWYVHLPKGDGENRWRVLGNEVQMLLHQHPCNVRRHLANQAPVNSLWFWGAGRLPSQVRTRFRGVVSDDVLLRALAARAGTVLRSPTAVDILAEHQPWLVDLHDLSVPDIDNHWWDTLQASMRQQPVVIGFASGERWLHRPRHRWRFGRYSTIFRRRL